MSIRTIFKLPFSEVTQAGTMNHKHFLFQHSEMSHTLPRPCQIPYTDWHVGSYGLDYTKISTVKGISFSRLQLLCLPFLLLTTIIPTGNERRACSERGNWHNSPTHSFWQQKCSSSAESALQRRMMSFDAEIVLIQEAFSIRRPQHN